MAAADLLPVARHGPAVGACLLAFVRNAPGLPWQWVMSEAVGCGIWFGHAAEQWPVHLWDRWTGPHVVLACVSVWQQVVGASVWAGRGGHGTPQL